MATPARAGGASTNSYEYTGHEADATGLYYFRARYYNPQIGRFISEDPIGLAGGANVFAYVDDSPTNFIDPFGLDKKPPWYKNSCITGALGNGALQVGLDSIGLIPEAGGAESLARDIGNWRGYRGIVADNFGRGIIRYAKGGANGASLGNGLGEQDWMSTGLAVAGFIPGLGQASAAFSIGYDIYRTADEIGKCN